MSTITVVFGADYVATNLAIACAQKRDGCAIGASTTVPVTIACAQKRDGCALVVIAPSPTITLAINENRNVGAIDVSTASWNTTTPSAGSWTVVDPAVRGWTVNAPSANTWTSA